MQVVTGVMAAFRRFVLVVMIFVNMSRLFQHKEREMRIWAMRIPVQSMFLVIAIFLLPLPVSADPTAEFEKIIEICEASNQAPLKCENDVWKFADITGDGNLSVAEISRMARLFGETLDRTNALSEAKNDGGGILAALLLGPSAAELVLGHFDYDDDGKVSRKELYTDLPEGKFTAFVETVTKSSQKALGDASNSLFGLWAKSVLGTNTPPKKTISKPTKKKDAGTRKWMKTESVSPVDDSRNVTLHIDSESGSSSLWIRCKENETNFFISFNRRLTGYGSNESNKEVLLRLGKSKAFTEQWSLSTSMKALGLWSGAKAIPFIRRMTKHKRLVVRTSESGGAPLTHVFPIIGIEKEIEPLAKACNWSEKNSIAVEKEAVETFEDQIAAALEANRSNSRPLTISETDNVRRHLAKCWNLPAGAKDAGSLEIEIHMVMNQDGTVREARISNQARMQGDPFYRAMAESALRAVLNPRCSPLKLPPEKYNEWQVMDLVFNPKEMFGT
jgi:hypothetical protein